MKWLEGIGLVHFLTFITMVENRLGSECKIKYSEKENVIILTVKVKKKEMVSELDFEWIKQFNTAHHQYGNLISEMADNIVYDLHRKMYGDQMAETMDCLRRKDEYSTTL